MLGIERMALGRRGRRHIYTCYISNLRSRFTLRMLFLISSAAKVRKAPSHMPYYLQSTVLYFTSVRCVLSAPAA